jgi:hypothetical protein
VRPRKTSFTFRLEVAPSIAHDNARLILTGSLTYDYSPFQCDFLCHRISSDISRRRSEQDERLALRAAEGDHKTSSYGRYLEQEDKRAERIKRREADIQRTSDTHARSAEETNSDKLDEERRARRTKEREEAKQREIARHPLLEFAFDERGTSSLLNLYLYVPHFFN